MNKYENAKKKIAEMISHSKIKTDPGHSLNTLEWLLKLRPDADEILQLAAIAHDIERATPDPLKRDRSENYDAHKAAHALRGAEIAKKIAKEVGYGDEEVDRLFNLIKYHEVGNEDPDVNVLMDADSISFFDFNIEEYLKHSGEVVTKRKILFMRDRASQNAKRKNGVSHHLYSLRGKMGSVTIYIH